MLVKGATDVFIIFMKEQYFDFRLDLDYDLISHLWNGFVVPGRWNWFTVKDVLVVATKWDKIMNSNGIYHL